MLQLRSVLRNRAQTVLTSTSDTAVANLKIFFEFINENLLLKSIFDELIRDLPNAEQLIARMQQSRRVIFPSSYREKVKSCISILLNMVEKNEKPYALMCLIVTHQNLDVTTQETMRDFFLPVWEYLDEKIVSMDTFQYLLIRFKLNSEWFKREFLYSLYSSDTSKGELALDKELRAYLFNQGIDFPFSKPSSPSGEVDVLSMIERKPIPLEIKVFDGDSRNNSHIRRGLIQAFSYASDYGESSGYLVIFNVSRFNLIFRLTSKDVPQRVVIGDKTIYLFVVNLFAPEKSASRRNLEPHEITEEYLLKEMN